MCLCASSGCSRTLKRALVSASPPAPTWMHFTGTTLSALWVTHLGMNSRTKRQARHRAHTKNIPGARVGRYVWFNVNYAKFTLKDRRTLLANKSLYVLQVLPPPPLPYSGFSNLQAKLVWKCSSLPALSTHLSEFRSIRRLQPFLTDLLLLLLLILL